MMRMYGTAPQKTRCALRYCFFAIRSDISFDTATGMLYPEISSRILYTL